MKYRVLTVSALCVMAAGLAVSGFSRAVQADHIPSHSNADPIFPVPLPGQEFFSGGFLFVTAIGPQGGQRIHNTSFDITWVSDGATPASDLHITIGMVLGEENPIYVETVVNGSDLGFSSGAGTFHGTYETSALNGVAVQGFFPPYSIVDISIGSINGGIQGTSYFVDSFINFDLQGATPSDVNGDGVVNVLDLIELLLCFGQHAVPPCDTTDINGDGAVNVLDLIEPLLAFGT